jgi:hypothetical protein
VSAIEMRFGIVAQGLRALTRWVAPMAQVSWQWHAKTVPGDTA